MVEQKFGKFVLKFIQNVTYLKKLYFNSLAESYREHTNYRFHR